MLDLHPQRSLPQYITRWETTMVPSSRFPKTPQFVTLKPNDRHIHSLRDSLLFLALLHHRRRVLDRVSAVLSGLGLLAATPASLPRLWYGQDQLIGL